MFRDVEIEYEMHDSIVHDESVPEGRVVRGVPAIDRSNSESSVGD